MPSLSTDRILGVLTSVAVKAPVKAVSTSDLTLAGLQVVGGVLLTEGDRVLVRNQSIAADNGIYDASTSDWTRSADFDGNRDVVRGTLVPHGESSGIFYRLTSADPVVIGTSDITFEAITLALVRSDLNALISQHPSGTNALLGPGVFDDSGKTGTTCYRNTAFGVSAMADNAATPNGGAGGSNSAFGYSVMQHIVESSGNSAFGGLSLGNITGVDSSHNNCFGYRTCSVLTAGAQNNCFGFQVCDSLLLGNNNHGFGENVLSHLLYGQGNACFGYQSCYTKIAGDYTHAFGYQSLFSETAAVITAISKAALAVVTISTVSAINPFSVGQPVIIENAAGMTEINGVLTALVSAIGGSSGAWTVTITINSSGFSVYTSGGYLAPLANTVFGYRAGYNVAMRGANTIIGFQSAGSDTAEPGYGNTCIGYLSGRSLNANAGGDGGNLNVTMGYWAGRLLTTGASNVVIGQQSGPVLTTGSDNIVIGQNAGNGLSTALRNVSIGSVTGVNLNGNDNTSVGYNAGSQASAQTYTNTTSLGRDATPTASNQVTLGNASVATLRCQQTTITALSDARFKKSIKSLYFPDEFFEELHMVTFEWSVAGMPEGPIVGVIAQELDELQKKYDMEWLGLVDKSDPDRWEATPGKILFLMTVYVQRQAKALGALTQRVAALEGDDQWRDSHARR